MKTEKSTTDKSKLVLIVAAVIISGGALIGFTNYFSRNSDDAFVLSPSDTENNQNEKTTEEEYYDGLEEDRPEDYSDNYEEEEIREETVDWKFYENREYKFEVRYPEEWEFDQEKTTANEIVFEIGSSIGKEAIEFKKNNEKLSLEQLKDSKIADTEVIKKQSETVVRGERALIIETTDPGTTYIIFNHNDYTYIVTTAGKILQEDVLSTFRFK